MPRTPQIRYFESRRAYYTQYNKKQYPLAAGPKDEPDGPTYLAAVRKFSELMNTSTLETSGSDTLVSVVIDQYYRHLERSGKTRSLKLSRQLLDYAIADFGHLKVRDLKPLHVNGWLDRRRAGKPGAKRRGWKDSTCAVATKYLSAALNLAASERLIPANPLAGMKRPYKIKTRGEEYILPADLADLLIARASRPFALAMRIMRATGCRPGEVFNADTCHWRPEIGALVFRWNATTGYIWKCARKTERDRTIFLPQDLQQEVAALIARQGPGPIIRTPLAGKRFSTSDVIRTFALLKDRIAVRKWLADHNHAASRVILYGFRHTYITGWLTSGRSIKVCADLCGTSVAMIEKHYSHLASDTAALRRMASEFHAA